MKVNAVVYFRVVEPEKAVVQVENYLYATSQLAQTTLRSVLGQALLDELLSEREKLNLDLQKVIDEHTQPWGIKVSLVEVKQVDLPPEMQRAMAKQAEAEREKRAKIIHAQGELEAADRALEGGGDHRPAAGDAAAALPADADRDRQREELDDRLSAADRPDQDVPGTDLGSSLPAGAGRLHSPAVPEPRTHYQISLTARQAVGRLLALLLVAGAGVLLRPHDGLVRAGTDRLRESGEVASGALPGDSEATDAMPPVETAVPDGRRFRPGRSARARSSRRGRCGRRRLPWSRPPRRRSTPSRTRTSEEPSPGAPCGHPGGQGPAAASARRRSPAGDGGLGKFWVQVASLSSRDEAGALSAPAGAPRVPRRRS